uniref:NADH-ubiquinone oxidoreductase chain 5 n=1 Tax=Ichneutes sp. QL-2013 TaxID=1421596 RepID=A0A0A6ZLV9_9HYME|nr:NADH dehydrogenase subunit 5 [Ichneutes sp. QL-2013]
MNIFIISFYMLILSLLMFSYMLIFMKLKIKMFLEWQLLNPWSSKLEFIIFLDWMSLMFISTVLIISSMVILYSMEYMAHDKFKLRFMLMIITFITSMIFMIISPNLMSILLGWDGLGLSSYCLINYYQNKKSFNSSMVTMLMNRFGDICILMTISMLLMKMSWNFFLLNKISILILFMIMITAFTKSAQIPFSAWLPMAMAAPTPVSSLVHSSTLVTAGVYLLIRFFNLLNYVILITLMFFSCFTMIMASLNALIEYDLKKIIALSTLSQLGLMIFTISIKLPLISFFHLNTHAMFKSLLFLCSGIIIHNYFNIQDIRFISFLNLNMPSTSMIFNMASLTLSGLPFMSGFYSKDLIIEMFNMNNLNTFIYIMLYLSMMMTVMYSMRLMWFLSMKFLNMPLMNKSYLSKMNFSIIILVMSTIFYGSISNWILFNSMNLIIMKLNFKLMIFFYLIVSIMFSLNMKLLDLFFKSKNNWFKFINLMFFLPFMFKLINFKIFKKSNFLLKINDLKWLEFLTSKSIILMFINLNKSLKINLKFLTMMMLYFMIIIFYFYLNSL